MPPDTARELAGLPFLKAHGLGNDFVILDARDSARVLTPSQAALLADRKLGIGCEQVLVLVPPRAGGTAGMEIFNADGSASGSCFNGARVAARLLFEETGTNPILLESGERTLVCSPAEPQAESVRASEAALGPARGWVALELGRPEFDWDKVPLAPSLARALETCRLEPAALAALLGVPPEALPGPAVALSLGNPHIVFALPSVEALAACDLERLGALCHDNPLFPERVNVQLAVPAPDAPAVLHHRVFERGVGLTLSSGSGAAAAAVAMASLGLAPAAVSVREPSGGVLEVVWRESEGSLRQIGPAAFVFSGRFGEANLGHLKSPRGAAPA